MLDTKSPRLRDYLLMAGKNYQINHLIDYNTEAGQAMKAVLEEDLKMALPDGCLAALKAHYADQANDKVATPPDRENQAGKTAKHINHIIALKAEYLDPAANQSIYNRDRGPVSIQDFQGIEHHNLNDYLVAIGKDHTVYDCIDYQSDIGKKIKSALESHLKIELPDRGIAGIKAIMQAHFGHQYGHVSDLSSHEIMAEIQTKYDYLEKHWRNHITPNAKDNFGVLDFNGEHHNRPFTYLTSVAKDEHVNQKIDYDSKVAAKMKYHLEVELECDNLPKRCLADPEAYQEALSQSRDRGLELDLGDW